MKKEKKGEAMLLEQIIFMILNLVFCGVLLVFSYNAGNQGFIYEQAYAKQIALLIDNAKPDMVILMNLDEVKPITEKNNKDLSKVFSINGNEVKVSLYNSGGYSYKYFSDNKVELNVDKNMLVITVRKGAENG